MSTIAIPTPPNPDDRTRLARFIRELTEQDRANPRPRTVTVWDGARGIYRPVDPKDTEDYLHLAAQEVDRLSWLLSTGQAGDQAGGRKSDAASVKTTRRRRWWTKLRPWLPGVTTSKAKAQHHMAACYLAAARKAAAEGRHIEAQSHARSCLALIHT